MASHVIRAHALDHEKELSESECDSLFQSLLDTGEVWHMDFDVVYHAAFLIKEGRIVAPTNHKGERGDQDLAVS